VKSTHPDAFAGIATRGERLRAARTKRFASARLAAIALGIPISTYGAHERAEQPGGRDYGPEQARHYASRFGVTPEWLLTGHRAKGSADVPAPPQGPASRTVPITGYVGAGGTSHLYSVVSDDLDELELPELVTASTVALEIRGNSMGAYLNHWFVLYDDLRKLPAADLVGQLCVVALKDDRILLKRLARGEAEGMFDLISAAAPPIRNVDIVWAAKVTAVIQR
jgi:SOS-response transcriptional repressor LexA